MNQDEKIVLVVEDEETLLQALAMALEGAGIKIITAKNGEEGLRLALDTHPTMILADNLMPVMDGTEMVAKIRQDSWGKTVPVVIITNVFLPEVMNKLFECSADYVLKSDLSIDKVVSMVQDRLSKAV
jgi:CheY-like chemotaxis protein